ncbi:MAG: hypothetical protein WD042_11355 [Phycisphaeraceae bacterium]
MKSDPIVEQVHRIRERMWDECGGDLDCLIQDLRAGEARHRDRIITPEQLEQMRRRSVQSAANRASE